MVEDTFAREDEPTVNTPVDDEKVNVADDVAPPPSMPKRTCVSMPLVKLPQPVQLVTVNVPIVELGVRNSDDDATPVTVREAICKFPVPVAFVKFNPTSVVMPPIVRLPANVELPFGKLIPPLGSSCNTLFALVPA